MKVWKIEPCQSIVNFSCLLASEDFNAYINGDIGSWFVVIISFSFSHAPSSFISIIDCKSDSICCSRRVAKKGSTLMQVRWDAAENYDESQGGKKRKPFNNHPTARVACASSLCTSPFLLYAIL